MDIDTNLREYTDTTWINQEELISYFSTLQDNTSDKREGKGKVKAIGSKQALHALQEELRQRGYKKAR